MKLKNISSSKASGLRRAGILRAMDCWRGAALIVAALLVSSCAANYLKGEIGREDALRPRVEEFNRMVYWAECNKAEKFVAIEERTQFAQICSALTARGRLLSLQLKDIQFANKSREAEVDVEVRYVQYTHPVALEQREKQYWVWSAGEGGWLFQSAKREGEAKPSIIPLRMGGS